MASTKGAALSKKDAASLKETTRDDYMNRQLTALKLRYEERAILGLGVVGTEASEAALQRYLKDEQTKLKDTAKTALDAVKRRMQ